MKAKIFSLIALSSVAIVFASCKNDDIEFGDYDYQTVYFANQTPVRTITLGEDVYSTELDNEHRFQVYARLGGVESNKTTRTINIAIDESLCDNLYFDDDTKVQPLPTDYYTISGNVITIGSETATTTLKTSETLCMRDRQSKYETFTYTEKE